MPENKKEGTAICLASGGMDSLTCVAVAVKKWKNVALLHLNYDQKTSTREEKAFFDIADYYGIPLKLRKVIHSSFLKEIGGSSLTDGKINVKPYQKEKQGIPDSYVPFRNTLLIAMAVSWGEVMRAQRIYIGAVHEDSSGYPDCRPSYYAAVNTLIEEGTKEGSIRVKTPLIHLKKKEIVLKALELSAPIELSWSCYARTDKACGVCDSCVLRLNGFKEAGIPDPLPYETNDEHSK